MGGEAHVVGGRNVRRGAPPSGSPLPASRQRNTISWRPCRPLYFFQRGGLSAGASVAVAASARAAGPGGGFRLEEFAGGGGGGLAGGGRAQQVGELLLELTVLIEDSPPLVKEALLLVEEPLELRLGLATLSREFLAEVLVLSAEAFGLRGRVPRRGLLGVSHRGSASGESTQSTHVRRSRKGSLECCRGQAVASAAYRPKGGSTSRPGFILRCGAFRAFGLPRAQPQTPRPPPVSRAPPRAHR